MKTIGPSRKNTFLDDWTEKTHEQKSLSKKSKPPSDDRTSSDVRSSANYDKMPESRLFRAVLIRAINDAAKGNTARMLDVANLIRDSSGDFDAACHYAS